MFHPFRGWRGGRAPPTATRTPGFLAASTMLPTASRVYVAQNVTGEDNSNAVVHVEAFEVDQNDEEGAGASDRDGVMALNRRANDCDAGGGGAATVHDDMNALYPVRLDQIPRTLRRVLAVCGFLTLVTSPGNPSKLHLGASFASVIASCAGHVLGFYLIFYYIFDDRLVSAIVCAAMSMFVLSSSYVAYAVVSSPVFRALMLNPASRKKMAKECDGMLVGYNFMNVVMIALVYYYVLFPELSHGDFYGDATRPIVWVCIIILPPMGIWSNVLQMWGDLIPVPCAERTTVVIEEYANSLKAILLNKKLAPDERLSRITKEQTRVEARQDSAGHFFQIERTALHSCGPDPKFPAECSAIS